MLGPPKLRAVDRPVTGTLDRLVPADYFYRHLDAALDLAFVREWVQDCYAKLGRPSIDPVVFGKRQRDRSALSIMAESRACPGASTAVSGRMIEPTVPPAGLAASGGGRWQGG